MRADGSTYKEIGAALGVTAETARHYVHRAKARASAALRRKMETPAALE
jgi:DNA-directed RNA polymerase specialized sigma24 family protein